jgi:hypothetical protein
MSINLTTTLAPSGAFCAMPQEMALGSEAVMGGDVSPENYLIYNPAVQEHYRGSYTAEQIDEKAAAWLNECNNIPVVEQAVFDVYGQTCIKLAKDVASVDAHLRLGPLRGAARPCVMAEVMTSGSVDFKFFNYKAGCQPENAGRVKELLFPILRDADPHQGIYRIQVVDTAVGGYGINALTRYLWDIKNAHGQFKEQKWELDYRIIHATDERTNVGKIKRVCDQAVTGVFDVNLERYVVTDLVVEDSESALGLKIVGDYGNYLVKQSYKPGELIIRAEDGIRHIRSQAEVVTYDELFSDRITFQMLNAPKMKQVGVVWNRNPELIAVNWSDYQLKG